MVLCNLQSWQTVYWLNLKGSDCFTGQMSEMRKLVVAISLSKSTANFSLTATYWYQFNVDTTLSCNANIQTAKTAIDNQCTPWPIKMCHVLSTITLVLLISVPLETWMNTLQPNYKTYITSTVFKLPGKTYNIKGRLFPAIHFIKPVVCNYCQSHSMFLFSKSC